MWEKKWDKKSGLTDNMAITVIISPLTRLITPISPKPRPSTPILPKNPDLLP